jgi:hypothetical protein
MNKLLALSVVVMLVGCMTPVGGEKGFERPNVDLHAPKTGSEASALLGIKAQSNSLLGWTKDYIDWHNEKQWEKINKLEARIDLLLKKIEADK